MTDIAKPLQTDKIIALTYEIEHKIEEYQLKEIFDNNANSMIQIMQDDNPIDAITNYFTSELN